MTHRSICNSDILLFHSHMEKKLLETVLPFYLKRIKHTSFLIEKYMTLAFYVTVGYSHFFYGLISK